MTNPADPSGTDPAGFDEPPAQPPTQPNLEARPDMMPPPGAPMGPPAGYGQYVPLAPPAPKRRGRTFGFVVLVIALMLGGGAAGYFLLGDSGDGGEAAIDDNTSDQENEEPGDETEPGEEEPDSEPEGDTIPIESLGAQVPLPSEAWQPTFGPGEDAENMSDAGGLAIQYEENWYATFQVGQYAVVELPYDSTDMVAVATELARFGAEQSATTRTTGGEYTDPETRELTVDGRPAVIAEATANWESSEATSDTYEHVVVFLVDVDGINALYGTAWVPESAESEYENVVSAFETTSFEE